MAVYFCLFVMCLMHVMSIESYVLKPLTFAIPPEGLTFEIKIKPEINHANLIKAISVKDLGPKYGLPHKTLDPHPKIEPTIEDRNGFRAGTCPIGYIKRGGFCFPDTDY
nr:uncharacterized protein LOC128677378 [Plodia interpunctella]